MSEAPVKELYRGRADGVRGDEGSGGFIRSAAGYGRRATAPAVARRTQESPCTRDRRCLVRCNARAQAARHNAPACKPHGQRRHCHVQRHKRRRNGRIQAGCKLHALGHVAQNGVLSRHSIRTPYAGAPSLRPCIQPRRDPLPQTWSGTGSNRKKRTRNAISPGRSLMAVLERRQCRATNKLPRLTAKRSVLPACNLKNKCKLAYPNLKNINHA